MERAEMEIIARLLGCEDGSHIGETELMDAVITKFLEEEKSKPKHLSDDELYDAEDMIREYLDENFDGNILSHATFRYHFNDDEDENPLGEAILRDALGLPPDFDFDD